MKRPVQTFATLCLCLVFFSSYLAPSSAHGAEQSRKQQSYCGLKFSVAGLKMAGTMPFADEVKPPLPAGLRFEIQYRPEYLEGGIQAGYSFKIRLRGEKAALNRIRVGSPGTELEFAL